jgi:hypothetical protein
MLKTFLKAISLLMGASFFFFSDLFAQTNVFPSTGNVGIGTTSPATDLNFTDLSTTSAATGISWYSASPTAFGIHRTAGSWTAPNYQQIRIGWATGIILDPGTLYGASYVQVMGGGLRVTSGNLAIGNITPAYPLDVTGTAQFRNGVRFTGLTNDNTQNNILAIDGNGNVFFRSASTLGGAGSAWGLTGNTAVNPTTTFLGTTDGSTVAFRTNNLERMRIDGATGNVGIGESSPQSLLAVKGTITSQKVVVTQIGWADYVFQPDYQLRSLKEVEEYIKRNGHLPELPTAEDINKTGDDLGASQVALLKKIEELTLYIIEQNKREKEQKEQLQSMQKRLDRLEKLIGEH